jgi:phage shock protein PspC (stress-responsive transcriptional regulator)
MSTSNPYTAHRLSLDTENKKIAGVCAGFARFLDADVLLVRIVWLALALGAGVGFIAYLVAWILMPRDAVGGAANYARQDIA